MMMAQSIVTQELGPTVLCCATWQSLATAGLCYDSAQKELNKNNVNHFGSKNTSDIQAKIKYMATINLSSFISFARYFKTICVIFQCFSHCVSISQ